MHVAPYFPVTAAHIYFRLFPSVMLGMCWEQTEQIKRLRSRLGARCLDRSANDVDAVSSEDAVEATAVLGVAVVDKESHGFGSILPAHREVASLLGDPGRVGTSGAPGDMDSSG